MPTRKWPPFERAARATGSVDLPMPRVGPVAEHAPKPIRVVLNWGRRYSLWVFNFGLACCAIEFIATSMARHDFIRLGVIPFAHRHMVALYRDRPFILIGDSGQRDPEIYAQVVR